MNIAGILAVVALISLFAGNIFSTTSSVETTHNVEVSAQQGSVATTSLRVLRRGDIVLNLLVADTDATLERGLSGRSALPPDQAMLFVFPEPQIYSFWMKDMKFPIDIAWLDPVRNNDPKERSVSNGAGQLLKVVYIKHNALPASYPEFFVPPHKALYVLETNAHFFEKNNISVGDTFSFSP
ncbi:MAG TPA: DUF192 domain-containing protein [Candidatus Paceibacterota bacterium]